MATTPKNVLNAFRKAGIIGQFSIEKKQHNARDHGSVPGDRSSPLPAPESGGRYFSSACAIRKWSDRSITTKCTPLNECLVSFNVENLSCLPCVSSILSLLVLPCVSSSSTSSSSISVSSLRLGVPRLFSPGSAKSRFSHFSPGRGYRRKDVI